MRYNFSFSTTDERLAMALKAYKESGGNISGLICNLLEQYFFSNNKEVITKEMMKIIELEKEIERIKEAVAQLADIEEQIIELKREVQKKEEQQKTIDELPLLRELYYDVFTDDLAKTAEEFFKRFEGKSEKEFKRVINVRLSTWASKKQISMPDAVRLFCKAFPELKHLFEVEVRA